jgi:hypothetical protein
MRRSVPPDRATRIFLGLIGGAFFALAVHSLWRGEFRFGFGGGESTSVSMSRARTDHTAVVRDPVGLSLCFGLLGMTGLVPLLYALYPRDYRLAWTLAMVGMSACMLLLMSVL